MWINANIIFIYHCYHRNVIKCSFGGFHQETTETAYCTAVAIIIDFTLCIHDYSFGESLWLHYDFSCRQYCLCLQHLCLFSQAVHSPPSELNSLKLRAHCSYSLRGSPPPFSIFHTKHKSKIKQPPTNKNLSVTCTGSDVWQKLNK